ncbi:hypothetical protein ACFVU0_19350 [Streptomyces sp. NPDC058122]|uniref:hypothetical protein n=1 Tax=Streptomyces sp. NPDC058122 TaxID=3346349 RepID=UPI0036EC8445
MTLIMQIAGNYLTVDNHRQPGRRTLRPSTSTAAPGRHTATTIRLQEEEDATAVINVSLWRQMEPTLEAAASMDIQDR